MQTKMSTPYSHHKASHPLQLFSAKPPPPSSSSSALSSMKIKNLIYTLIVSRIIRALSKVKTSIVDILKENNNSRSKTNKIIMGSFRLHYNWCSSRSSHVIPVPSRVYEGLQGGGEDYHDSKLEGYLQWLEEQVLDGDDEGINQIDKLAEAFIANCHEKFRLEKQESDRKFHEMLARGL